MNDKRKLIRELLRCYPSENSFFDLKEDIDFSNTKAKQKLIKHICGLSNSNLDNDSFLILGIRNKTRDLVGSPWRDDAGFQDLLSEYLSDCPLISYDNVIFPELAHDKFIGLLTIRANKKKSSIKKPILSFTAGTKFFRYGSQTLEEKSLPNSNIPSNKSTVEELYRISKVSLDQLIKEVLEFYHAADSAYSPTHIVFNDQYVLCYSAYPNAHADAPDLFSEVTINLINENITLFISAVDYVKFQVSRSSFAVIEMAHLYFLGKNHFIPRRETVFSFNQNSDYKIKKNYIFVPPKIRKKDCNAILSRYQKFLQNWQMKNNDDLLASAETLCDELLVACLNGDCIAEQYFLNYLNGEVDGCIAESYYRALDIFEKHKNFEL